MGLSLKEWKDRFYPVAAEHVPHNNKAAIEHAIRKWSGLDAQWLAVYGLKRDGKVLFDDDLETFSVSADTCVLCQMYLTSPACVCCPLSAVRGEPCDEITQAEYVLSQDDPTIDHPYGHFLESGDTRPMLRLLYAALEREEGSK